MATIAGSYVKMRSLGAYISVAKPGAILPHLITTTAAMLLATENTPPVSILIFTLAGGTCIAAAANTFNSLLDRDIDALMIRTRHRPLPSGQMKPDHALIFGIFTGLVGISILSGLVNWATAVLSMLALAYYIIPYTLWLKRRTYWSAIICSGIGAIPPLIGWVAVSPHIGLTPFLLSGIIILWTIPHFWALAIFRLDDYKRAGLIVLPLKGAVYWIIACSILLVADTLVLTTAADLGFFYLGVASFLGVGLLGLALLTNRDNPLRKARNLYRYSILYIAILFGAMIIDRIVF